MTDEERQHIEQMTDEKAEARFEELKEQLGIVPQHQLDTEPSTAPPIELVEEFEILKKRLGFGTVV